MFETIVMVVAVLLVVLVVGGGVIVVVLRKYLVAYHTPFLSINRIWVYIIKN